MTGPAGRARTHDGVRGDRARPDQGAAPARHPAQLRNLVHLRDRLQPVAQPDHQRDAGAQRHADRRRHRADLRRPIISPTRLTDRIDNVGSQVMDEIEQVMAMIDAAVGSATNYTESLADARRSSAAPRIATACARSSRAWCTTTKEMEQNNQALEAAAQRLQAGDQPAPGKPRGGAHREPDRSADLARQPQVLRRGARQGDRATRSSAASRCR